MATIIRIADDKDFKTVKHITQTTIRSVYPKYYPEGAVLFFCNHHSDDKIMDDIKNEKVFLLEVEDVPIGTVTVSDNEINRLFVLPESQLVSCLMHLFLLRRYILSVDIRPLNTK